MKVSTMKTFLLQFFSLMMLCEPYYYYSSFFQEAHTLSIQYTIPVLIYIISLTTRTKPSLYYGTVRVLKTYIGLAKGGDYPSKNFQNNERTKTKIKNKERRAEKGTFLYKKVSCCK